MVQVIDTGGRKFEIPLSKLNEESKLLVLEFEDNSLELYKLLTQKEIIFQKGIDSNKNTKRLFDEYMDFCKKFGVYEEFGPNGLPVGSVTMASIIVAINERRYEKICSSIIYTNFGPSSSKSNIKENDGNEDFSQLTRQSVDFIGELNTMAKTSVVSKDKYLIEDIRDLQRALIENVQQIALRGSRNKFFITGDVRKYASRIENKISLHIHKLGITK